MSKDEEYRGLRDAVQDLIAGTTVVDGMTVVSASDWESCRRIVEGDVYPDDVISGG